MSETKAEKYSPQTDLGKELQDILNTLTAAGCSKAAIQAALVGRCGVCASAWEEYIQADAEAKKSGGFK